jgi:hypothetical protein
MVKTKFSAKEVVSMLWFSVESFEGGSGSQRALARKIGCTNTYLNRVLKGIQPPGPRICRYLGVRKVESEAIYERVT